MLYLPERVFIQRTIPEGREKARPTDVAFPAAVPASDKMPHLPSATIDWAEVTATGPSVFCLLVRNAVFLCGASWVTLFVVWWCRLKRRRTPFLGWRRESITGYLVRTCAF